MRSLYFLIWQLCAFAFFNVALGANISPPNLRTEKNPGSLQMMFSLFRHGDRAPVFFWPNDPYKNYSWHGGAGALSEKGINQLYTLGQNLRHRYSYLIPMDGRYCSHNMIVKSSHVERCIMSGLSLLAGFIPPHEDLNHLPIAWQPVPITTLPKSQDTLLAQDRPCKKYDRIFQEFVRNPPADLKKLKMEHEDLFRILKQTGWKNISFVEIGSIYNTLSIQRDNGFPLPDWSEDIYPEKMRPFAERAFTIRTETPYMKQVKAGPFITEVFNSMVEKQKNTLSPDRKIFFYAAHEYTIIAILNALGVIHQATFMPQYASMLVLELHTSEVFDDDLEVKLVYYDNSDVTFPKELCLPSCPCPCSLTNFGVAIKDLLVDDYEKLCDDSHY